MKKIIVLALTGTLLLGSSFGVMAAPGQQQSRSGVQQMSQDSPQGQPPQMNGNDQQGQPPQMNGSDRQGQPSQQNGQQGADQNVMEKKDLPEGAIDIMAVEKAIDAIEDATVKANIQALLDDLKAALQDTAVEIVEHTDATEDATAEDVSDQNVSAIQTAEEALKAALVEAGINLSDYVETAPADNKGDRNQDDQRQKMSDSDSSTGAPALPEITDENEESVFQQTVDYLGSHLQSFYNWLTELLGDD